MGERGEAGQLAIANLLTCATFKQSSDSDRPCKNGARKVFPRICLPELLAKFLFALSCELLPNHFFLSIQSPICLDKSWEVSRLFFAVGRHMCYSKKKEEISRTSH